MKFLRPVEVYWVDSQSNNGWQGVNGKIHDTSKGSLLCRSVGMFVKKTKDRIILAQSVAFENKGYVYSMNDTITIPLCAVKEIKKL
jgi:hypothetical protein